MNTPMEDAYAGLHETFKVMVEQGFTEYQACLILSLVITHNPQLWEE